MGNQLLLGGTLKLLITGQRVQPLGDTQLIDGSQSVENIRWNGNLMIVLQNCHIGGGAAALDTSALPIIVQAGTVALGNSAGRTGFGCVAGGLQPLVGKGFPFRFTAKVAESGTGAGGFLPLMDMVSQGDGEGAPESQNVQSDFLVPSFCGSKPLHQEASNGI